MNSAYMKYKNFVFEKNPAVIEIKASSKIIKTPLIDGCFVSEGASVPSQISAKGCFFGENAAGYAAALQRLAYEKGAGALMLPGGEYFEAYLADAVITESADKNSVSYSLLFVEAGRRKGCFQPAFVFAAEGENAFDIANRTGIAVEMIMEKNSFRSPFDIKKGDKVILD